MIARSRGFNHPVVALTWLLVLHSGLLQRPAQAINIFIDYRYDPPGPNQFFNTQQKKDALQAVADRYSAIITTSLSAASLSGSARIGFKHPTTGVAFEVSAATSAATDALAPPNCMLGPSCYVASEYRAPWLIPADQWILYAGGSPLPGSQAASGGTATGLNQGGVFTSGSSHLNRGFRTTGTQFNLPVWGGSITFDNDGTTNWHFDPATAAPAGKVDFYTFALHEIGHALGLNIGFAEWTSKTESGQFFNGANSMAAYNADNGTSFTRLSLQGTANNHWKEDQYNSQIFQNAGPKLSGTVGTGALQDLLMEPNMDLTATVRRLELTNVDVAALRDVGWSTVPQINTQPGDFNGNGAVDAADYIPLSKGLASGSYATWKANYGESLAPSITAGSSHVPEPRTIALLAIALLVFFASPRKNSVSLG